MEDEPEQPVRCSGQKDQYEAWLYKQGNKTNTNIEIVLPLHLALTQTLMEYYVLRLCPQFKEIIEKLQKVQKTTTRVIKGLQCMLCK